MNDKICNIICSSIVACATVTMGVFMCANAVDIQAKQFSKLEKTINKNHVYINTYMGVNDGEGVSKASIVIDSSNLSKDETNDFFIAVPMDVVTKINIDQFNLDQMNIIPQDEFEQYEISPPMGQEYFEIGYGEERPLYYFCVEINKCDVLDPIEVDFSSLISSSDKYDDVFPAYILDDDMWDEEIVVIDANSREMYYGKGDREKIIDLDCNGDGSVNALDASDILVFAAKQGAGYYNNVPSWPKHMIYDSNNNGHVDATDASLMLRMAADLGASNITNDYDLNLYLKDK